MNLGLLALGVVVLASAVFPGLQAHAAPLPCDVQTPTECQITSLHSLGAGGTFTVDRTLRILGAPAELRVDPEGALTLEIAAGLIIAPGGKITGDAQGSPGLGASIAIHATGQVLLEGTGTSGALISAEQPTGACGRSRAGDITITSAHGGAGNAIVIQEGARVTTNARCMAGSIIITASAGRVVVAGTVEAEGNSPGAGARKRPGGGPITIEASCDLTVTETGKVSSRGRDTGADLVRLVGGCAVVIKGLVESTGPGHGPPNSPANQCAGASHPDKPANSTACIQIVAGTSLLIDATGGAHGEINADVGQSGGSGMAWIDIFASGPITIKGATGEGVPFVVHANEFVSNSPGGLITVKSVTSKVSLAGNAIEASGGSLGGDGGVVTIEAGGTGSQADVDLGTAIVRALGGTSGNDPDGGIIAVRSFNGKVTGAAPGRLDAGAVNPGTVTLRACAGVTYTGTSVPAATLLPAACGGAPLLPASVTLPACQCAPPPCEGPDCPCEGPNCPPCEGPNCLPSDFCQVGTVQAVLDPVSGRFPGNLGPDVVVDVRTSSLQAAIDTASDTNNDGYIIIGVVAQDGGQPGGSAFQTVEVSQPYPKPFVLIGCSITLNDPEPCDGKPAARIHASAGSPEFPPGSGVTLYVQEISVLGSNSSSAWLVEGDGRFLEAIEGRSSLKGVHIAGNNNTLARSFANGNTISGVTVEGDHNSLIEVKARNNATGEGIHVVGDDNLIARSTAESNGDGDEAGVRVAGTGNLIRASKAFSNRGSGFHVSGGTVAAPNLLKGNTAGASNRGNLRHGIELQGAGPGAAGPVDVLRNRTEGNSIDGLRITGTGHRLKDNSSGGGAASNFICQYRVDAGNLNATGNTVGATLIPGANGTPFPASCF